MERWCQRNSLHPQICFHSMRIPLLCSNGIGDSFLILGRVPIGILGKLGFRFKIFYTTTEHPARKILEPFFRGIRYCEYMEREPSAREKWFFSKMLSLSMRTAKIWCPPFDQSAKIQGFRKKFFFTLIWMDITDGREPRRKCGRLKTGWNFLANFMTMDGRFRFWNGMRMRLANFRLSVHF